MKQKIKEFSKKYLVGFIIGSILFGTLGVYAVTYFPGLNTTYDNSDSGMTSTNVQDALDELYNVCVPPKAGDQIIEDAGLEKDPYECRYFFTGGNPNNYITFNDEKAGWRIISVECDGSIKIMRINSIGNQSWDTIESNDWARPASLNAYLNGTYYNDELNASAKSQIVAKDWNIGVLSTWSDDDLSNTISKENSKKWNGKIALPTISEYIRSNSNKNACGTLEKAWNAVSKQCISTTWMYASNIIIWWMLTPYDAGSGLSTAFSLKADGTFILDTDDTASSINAVRPTLYLSPDIKITGGTGTESDPYTIE